MGKVSSGLCHEGVIGSTMFLRLCSLFFSCIYLSATVLSFSLLLYRTSSLLSLFSLSLSFSSAIHTSFFSFYLSILALTLLVYVSVCQFVIFLFSLSIYLLLRSLVSCVMTFFFSFHSNCLAYLSARRLSFTVHPPVS